MQLSCLDAITERRSPDAVSTFVAALKDSDNDRIRGAAVGLARLGDPSAIAPLIDALVTVHTIEIPGTGNRSADSISTTFSNEEPEITVGDGRQVVEQAIANQDVLSALVTLTGGVDYHFDREAWRSWYESQKQTVAFNARRD